jgi:hypothetical protein
MGASQSYDKVADDGADKEGVLDDEDEVAPEQEEGKTYV